jgi:hypothetical protein
MIIKIREFITKIYLSLKEKDHKNRLRKFRQILSKRDAYVFLVFLFISTAFWFLNALRDDYVTDFFYPVRFVNVPENEIIVDGMHQKVNLKIKASGFTILRQRLNSSFVPVVYDISQMRRLERNNQDLAYVLSRSQLGSVRDQLLVGMELVDINPDTLFLKMDQLMDRKVPVVLHGEIDFEKQFILADSVRFAPDSVTITGPASVVDTIAAVYSKFLVTEKLKDNYTKKIPLQKPHSVKISHNEATITILVEPFSEKSFSVPIMVVGLPDSLRMKTFPSSVMVTFRAGMSQFDKISPDDFIALVDAAEVFQSERPTRIRVRFDQVPDNIQSYDFTPIFVEYFLERQQ